MAKKCVIQDRICIECGECSICDLDNTKKCNNCGRCLSMEGYDTKAIKIEDIYLENGQGINEGEEGSDNNSQLNLEYLEDIPDLQEFLQHKDSFTETFPGLYIKK